MPSSNATLTLGQAFYYAAAQPCTACFSIFFVVLFLIVVFVIITYVVRKRRDWGLDEQPRDLTRLRRHQRDVALQENLSRSIAEYWAYETNQVVAEEVNTELDVRENTETESLDFNAELEARRRAFIKSLRKNAFRKKVDSDEWSVTLYDMTTADELDAEALLTALAFVTPQPIVFERMTQAFLKEQVRLSLFTLLRKINFEGYDCHVAALVSSAVVVWNDGEIVIVAGRPFYPPFPILKSQVQVGRTLQSPADEDEELRRLKEPPVEVGYKMSFEQVMALESSIDRDLIVRRRRLKKMKQKSWTKKLARQLVNALSAPRVFKALALMDSERKNQNINKTPKTPKVEIEDEEEVGNNSWESGDAAQFPIPGPRVSPGEVYISKFTEKLAQKDKVPEEGVS